MPGGNILIKNDCPNGELQIKAALLKLFSNLFYFLKIEEHTMKAMNYVLIR